MKDLENRIHEDLTEVNGIFHEEEKPEEKLDENLEVTFEEKPTERDWDSSLNKALLNLVREGNYKELSKLIQEGNPKLQFIPRLKNLINSTEPKCSLPPFLSELETADSFFFNKETTPILDYLVDYSMCEDNAELLQWLVGHSNLLEKNHQYYLDCVVLEQSYNCIKFLLSLDIKWELSPPVYFLWSQKNFCLPLLDGCVEVLEEYFLPKQTKKNKKNKQETTAESSLTYPKLPFKKLLKLKKYDTSSQPPKDFIEILMNYYACTPFMRHCIVHELLTKSQIEHLVNSLEKAVYETMRELFTIMPELTLYAPRLLATGMFQELAPLTFTHFQDSPAKTLDVLLTHHPELIEQKSVRCMVTILALTEEPMEAMVERAKNLTGEQLEITYQNLPWFYPLFQQNTCAVPEFLYTNWEKVMPKQIKPVISYSNLSFDELFQIYDMLDTEEHLVAWLEHCEVVGDIPTDELSALGCQLLELPCDHPTFLKSLQPGGVLFQEKKLYLEKLFKEKDNYYAHYLLSLALCKEEKSYEL